MNISQVIRPTERMAHYYSPSLGIQAYGRDNLYPQMMEAALKGSPTGGSCRDRYETFIFGGGFSSEELARTVMNRHGDTADDILALSVHDLATFGGIAVHVNYDLSGRITEISHVPFADCRLAEEDDRGYIPFICTHPDWSGRKTRRGRQILVTKNNISRFYPFNPLPEVILSQMEADGGVERYRGQLLWFSMAGRGTYPEPIYDKVITALSTDEGLDNVKYRNVRNNFLPAGMLIRKKGGGMSWDGTEGSEAMRADKAYTDSLISFQGDTNALAIMDITVNADEDVPTWKEIHAQNFDKEFTATESSVTERIYSAFGQEPWYSIRVGKLGFSGQLISEAYEYYNSYVARERQQVERIFARLFNYWATPLPVDGVEIRPLEYINNDKEE